MLKLTSNVLIPRCCLPEDGTELFLRACRTCSMLMFPHLTNQILNLLRCHCRSLHRCQNFLLSKMATTGKLKSTTSRFQNSFFNFVLICRGENFLKLTCLWSRSTHLANFVLRSWRHTLPISSYLCRNFRQWHSRASFLLIDLLHSLHDCQ